MASEEQEESTIYILQAIQSTSLRFCGQVIAKANFLDFRPLSNVITQEQLAVCV